MNTKDSTVDEPDKKKRKLIISEKGTGSSVKFDGNNFRKLIKGEHPLGALKQLVAVARNTNDQIISDYLKAGGSALEVILVIDKLENKIYYQYQPIFAVLSLIITKCREEFPHLIPSTEEACKRLLRHNNQAIHATLGPNSSQAQKKIGLTMLTSMVLLSGHLAREVLSTLSLRELTVNHLTKHPPKYNADSTRGHYIRYVLAYFYHDNILLLRQLLDHRYLLQAVIAAGLTLDDAQLLVVFLTTLKEKIVDNPQIIKTTKLKMFNTKIMIKLLEAYTWTGPPAQSKNKAKGNDQAEEVTNCVHQLLLRLCTNHKLGVAFVDPTVGLDEKNYNELVLTVIKSMDPYWNIELVRELGLKILVACPDLVTATFKHFGMQGFFKPEVTFSFVHTCEFAKQVINNLSADRNLVRTATADQLTYLTIRTVFNTNMVQCVQEGLKAIHPTIRLLAVQLLNSIFQSLNRFLNAVKAWFSSSPKINAEYQQKIYDYISKNITVEQELMVTWSLGIGGDQSQLKTPTETEYYLPLVDLLLSYSQVFPVYLPPTFISQLQTTVLDTIDPQTKELFDVKVIKFIIMFKNIQPSQVEFGEIVTALVPLLAWHDEAKCVLRSLLLQTGYFDGVEAEVDVWVTTLSRFSDCESNLSLFLATLDQVVSKPKHCMRMVEESTDQPAVTDIVDFNWSELVEVAKNPMKTLTPSTRMLPTTRLSILVPALIRVLNTKHSDVLGSSKFVLHLLGDILFSQVEYGKFLHVIEQCKSAMVDPVKEYINSLDHRSILKNIPFGKRSPEYLMMNTLVSSSYLDEDPLQMVGKVDAATALLLVKLVVFFAVRINDEDVVSRCSRILPALLSQFADDCPLRPLAVEEVLLHPLVLQGFCPLQAPTPANLAPLVLAVVEHTHILIHNKPVLEPYRQRFVDDILSTMRRRKKLKRTPIMESCIKLMSGEEIVTILSALVEFRTDIDHWTPVADSLLQAASSVRCLLPGGVITALCGCDQLQNSLAQYLNIFPHLIDFLDKDHLTREQENLNKLCCLLLKADSEKKIQTMLLDNKKNRKNPRIFFASLTASSQQPDVTNLKHSSHLVRCIVDALASENTPDWLLENAEVIGKFITQLPDDVHDEVLPALFSVTAWTEAHIDIAGLICPARGRTADYVVHTLRLLMPLMCPDTVQRAETVCAKLRKTIMDVSSGVQGDGWEQVRISEEWQQWTRAALKLGETLEYDAGFLLCTLSSLCAIVYSGDPRGTKTLTEMVLSHSQFLTVMLAKPTPTKSALLELLLSLLQLDSSMMVSSHIPILLAAYSASLSATDQLILQLLQLYENNGIALTEWKPFLWGEAAASFYSVRSTIAPGLWNKHNCTQLMDLFEERRVNATLANFPTHRGLRTITKVEEQSNVYDPAFYLPTLVATFAPSEVFFTYKTCQSGCLSLVLAALSSTHEDVRTVAYVALQRFYCHLISNTNNQDTLWLHFLDAVRLGLSDNNGVPRLSCVVAVFLSRCVLVLTSPADPLYLPLSQFLLAKPRFHLDTAPELLPLFNSFSVQHHSTHQEWILRVLRDGLRDDQDFNIFLNSMAFKIILDYFSSTLASDRAKALILEVLEAAVKLKSGRSLLINGYSLCPWLSTVVKDPGLPTVLLSPLISVLANLLHKSSASQVVPLLVHVACHNQLTEAQLTAVLAALAPHLLSAVTVRQLLEVVDTTVGEVLQLRTMLENGVKYVELDRSSNKNAKECLKEIIVRFLQSEELVGL